MNITKKEKAIECMKAMDIYKPYITGFEQNDKVCFFEATAAFGFIKSRKSKRK